MKAAPEQTNLRSQDLALLALLGPFIFGSKFNVPSWRARDNTVDAKKIRGATLLLWMQVMVGGALLVALFPHEPGTEPDRALYKYWIGGWLVFGLLQALWLGGKSGDRYLRQIEALPKLTRSRIAAASCIFYVGAGAYFLWAA
jgi:hypothetical protein